ncbi:MAG: UPF0158 family protein [Planctomycetota bacterium]|jgi:hypothetical protein
MAIRVKLDEIIEGLEFQSDESSSFLDKTTGKVVLISEYEMCAAEDDEPDEDSPDWEQDLIGIAKEIIDETGNYIALPTKFDIHEYSIMKGRGAFRRFNDAIRDYGIADDWYKYRDDALKEIAIEWCKENDIEFDDK